MSIRSESPDIVKKVVLEVSQIVSDMAGIQLGERQESMVENRLRTRMLKLGLPHFSEYLNYLKSNQEVESQALLSLLTTHHTYFFREFSHFEYLLNHGVNQLVERAKERGDKTIRIWSAACSRGQEVYSLAMFFNFHIRHIAPDVKFEIYASDVDPESVEIAKNGVYKNDELKQCPAMYMEGNWSRGSGEVVDFSKVKDSLKSFCKFHVVNLFTPENFLNQKTFDLIFCRNVFIYFKPDQIKQITQSFMKHLDPKGFLYLGVSESLNGLDLPIALTGPSVYRHKEAISHLNTKSKISSGSYKIPPSLMNDASVIKAFDEPTPSEKQIFNVLCVDDSSTIHALLGKILTPDQHFKITAKAMNGREALDILKTQKFDIITLDLHMPEIDGVGFLKEYKGSIPVVVLSSINRDDPSVAQQALKFGAKDYIEKPSLDNFAQACNEIRSKLKTVLSLTVMKPATSSGQDKATSSTSVAAKKTVTSDTVSKSMLGTKTQLTTPVTPFKKTPLKNSVGSSLSKSALNKPVSSLQVKHSVGNKTSIGNKTSFVSAIKPKSNGLSPQKSSLNSSVSKDEIGKKKVLSPQTRSIKTLIVDDSATIRKLLKEILSADPLFNVVAEAEKPSQVEDLILKFKPDLITLDIHMPEMDGVSLLKNYITRYKIPTVMISSISKEEGPFVLDALESGAVDYIQKPQMNQLNEAAQTIRERLKIASQVKVRARQKKVFTGFTQKKFNHFKNLVLIGSSTGGTEALKDVFECLPKEIPPILVVQHIPPVFSAAFAQRLNTIFPFEIREAKDGDLVVPNQVLIAPGGKQMGVVKKGSELVIKITEDAPVNRHKPSVDYLFKSVAEQNISNLVAGVLTGMGADGANELKVLRQQGAKTFAQDEATSVVYGMPKEAYERGGAECQVALENVGAKIIELCNQTLFNKKAS